MNLLLHIWVKKIRLILKAPSELNINWGEHIYFSSFWNILICTAWGEGKYKTKLQVIVNFTRLGCNAVKRNILMNIYWCLEERVHELRGRNSACYSRKTIIFDFKSWEGPWNYKSKATNVKHGPDQFFQKICKVSQNYKSWNMESFEWFQYGGHF